PEALRELPGIGPYTAGAIASIAFGLPVPALDANIRRLYARLLNVEEPLGLPATEKLLRKAAQGHLPHIRTGDFNQALMELGALICKPKRPLCLNCPIQSLCKGFALGTQEQIPVRKQKPAIPHHIVTAAVIADGDRVLIAQRPQGGLLGGLWEFPGGKLEPADPGLPACLKREIREELDVDIQVGEPFGVYHHAYTHFRITLHAFICTLEPGQTLDEDARSSIRWVLTSQLDGFAMGKVDRQIARRLASL
ncbi:MAG: NUDIX domain-containing protein, partial [Anaerolineaceae bacterium]